MITKPRYTFRSSQNAELKPGVGRRRGAGDIEDKRETFNRVSQEVAADDDQPYPVPGTGK